MGDILTKSAEYDNIRALVGVPESQISDATIELLVYLPWVENEVKEIVVDWETIVAGSTPDNLRLKTGVSAWTASRLCGHIQREEGRRYQIADYGHRANAVDWVKKAMELAEQAADNLASISTGTPAPRATLMTVNGPTRAGTNVPATFQEWLDKIRPEVIQWLDTGTIEGQ